MTTVQREDARVSTVESDGITFRSEMTVELVKANASDADVLFAARVSTKGEQSLEDVDADASRSSGPHQVLDARSPRLAVRAQLDDLLRLRADLRVPRVHAAPGSFSYNEESGRYRELRPVFYVPGPSAS